MGRRLDQIAFAALLATSVAACSGEESSPAMPMEGGGSGGNVALGGAGAAPGGGGNAAGGESGSAGASCVPFSTNGRSWSLRDIDVIGGAPIYPDVTLDPNDRPVVAFRKGTDTLRYAAVSLFDAGAWSAPDVVDQIEGRFLGKRPSIAIDSGGTMHVVAYDEDDWRPRHSLKAPGGDWTTAILYEEGVDAGDHSSLAIDDAGSLYLSFVEYGSYHVVFGYRGGAEWAFETVADGSGPITGSSSSIAVTPGGDVLLAVHGREPETLALAVGPGPVWSTADVDTTAGAGYYPSIALDRGGTPSIGYLRWANQDADVRVATRSGAEWTVDVVDAELGISYTTGLVSLGCGTRAVAYGRNEGTGTGGLWFAYHNPGDAEWTREVVDSSSYVSGIDMVADAAGRIHVVYLDETNFVLEHAMLE